MNYKLNPVKATCMKYDGKEHGIQGINDTCFGICAAFSGTNDVYDMDPECSKACVALVEKRKHELFGVGSCDHQVPYRPVAWGQVPRFVPNLLSKGTDVITAKNQCMRLCESVPNLKEECQDKCILDSNAVEPIVENYSNVKGLIVAPTDEDKQVKASPIRGILSKSSKPSESSKSHVAFICILIALILIVMVMNWSKK